MSNLSVQKRTSNNWLRLPKCPPKKRIAPKILIWALLLTFMTKNGVELAFEQVKLISKLNSKFAEDRIQYNSFYKQKGQLKRRDGWNIFNENSMKYKDRKVPKGISRFDYPWRVPMLVRSLTAAESNNRFLYSPLKDVYSNGLGHNLATINGEVWTALRLNLTYTHRISLYSVHSIPFFSSSSRFKYSNDFYRPFLHSGSVEQLFGWGVHEIPREHIQNTICDASVLSGEEGICRVCTTERFLERKSTTNKTGRERNILKFSVNSIEVDNVVELPYNLSYGFPFNPTAAELKYAVSFMGTHSKPNTVFTLPSDHCATNPVIGKFSRRQKAYFFHKYWNAHEFGALKLDTRSQENESFESYKMKVLSDPIIGAVGRRPKLTRLKKTSIIIAVHARRGDFFIANRSMISIALVARIVRQIMKLVIEPIGGPFSKLSVAVNIYSEGLPLDSSQKQSLDHDVNKLGQKFMDSDGTIMESEEVRNFFIDENMDNLGIVFETGLDINLMISDNTILSIHEMIAADIFIGSESGLSANVVGCSSRAAFLIIPGNDALGQSNNVDDLGMLIRFDYNTTKLSPDHIIEMKERWKNFQNSNKDSI